ncbi:3-hydroxyacyl-CoA dehydrogenase family protein [Amycolatopsis ultiminotia]|uniref:3-hydroxyacyl-CoA dehydrogenase family protein n=1 Tax=Amycolatopsis ultiminotia TaxID=543629 RepID=A0ABP6UXC7_9PSEU
MTKRVAVIGAGTMGIGIAYVFAAAGWPTTVVEPQIARMTALRDQMATAAEGGVARGRLSAAAAAVLPGLVTHLPEVAELPSGLDLVIETVPESLELKQRVLVAAERAEPLVLASNTSSLSIDRLAGRLTRPACFLGMHFFNPVWSLPLVEVVRGAATDEDTLRRTIAAAEAVGKQTAVVRDMPGFATSRLDVATSLEAIRMVQEGVGEPAEIDRAVQLAYRHPVGPLRLADIVGLDVRLDIARSLSVSLGPRFEPPRLLVDKVAAGELGQKSGQGFYQWDEQADR